MREGVEWIFCCGMQRSGSSLHYWLTRDVVALDHGTDLGYVIWQDFDDIYKQNYRKDSKKPFIIRGHPYYPEHSKIANNLFNKGRAVALYTYRDIRDVVSSMIWHRKIDPYNTQAVEKELTSILRAHNLWTNIDYRHFYMTKYEKMIKNIALEVVHIASFLGIDINSRQAMDIESTHGIEAAKSRSGIKEWAIRKGHINKGEIGQYKNLPSNTLAVIEIIGDRYLRYHGYIQ